MNRFKRLSIVILSILMLLPSVISYGAIVCPYCGGGPTTCRCPKMKCEKCGGEFNTTLYTKHVEICTGSSNDDENEEAGSETNEAFKSALNTFLGHTPSEQELYEYSLIVTTLTADGLEDVHIAGIVGNVMHESGGKPYKIEGYYSNSNYLTVDGKKCDDFVEGGNYDFGNTQPAKYESGACGVGLGIIQWSHGRASNLDKFATDNADKFGYVTVKHWMCCKNKKCTGVALCLKSLGQRTVHIPNMAGQTCFIVQELNSSHSSVKTLLLATTTTDDAADVILEKYEMPGDLEATRQGRRDQAKAFLPVVQACTGVVGTNSGTGGASEIASYMAGTQLWDEKQLSSFCQLSELNVQIILNEAQRDKLNQDQLDSLADWENNIAMDKEEDGWISLLRKCVMLVGILFTVWMLLIYISYWFDRLNNFIDLDLLGILSFGFLHISDTEEECTFHINDLGTEKSNGRTVNHRAILTIILIGIGFGVLLISGVFYIAVAGLVNTVRDWLN